jgi:hypothetical protein
VPKPNEHVRTTEPAITKSPHKDTTSEAEEVREEAVEDSSIDTLELEDKPLAVALEEEVMGKEMSEPWLIKLRKRREVM